MIHFSAVRRIQFVNKDGQPAEATEFTQGDTLVKYLCRTYPVKYRKLISAQPSLKKAS